MLTKSETFSVGSFQRSRKSKNKKAKQGISRKTSQLKIDFVIWRNSKNKTVPHINEMFMFFYGQI